jgi:tetratricopeptide (TPR) repeat protein
LPLVPVCAALLLAWSAPALAATPGAKDAPKAAEASSPGANGEQDAKKKKPARPRDAELHFSQGNKHFMDKRYQAALESFDKCLAADESFAPCHMMLGSCYAKLRQPEKGAEHYRKFVELAPDDPKAAMVRTLLEQYDGANPRPASGR